MEPNQRIPMKSTDRRYFIGGSDARIIMGNDEAALVRLWREKRGDWGRDRSTEPKMVSGEYRSGP